MSRSAKPATAIRRLQVRVLVTASDQSDSQLVACGEGIGRGVEARYFPRELSIPQTTVARGIDTSGDK